jgi:hypothetical protein
VALGGREPLFTTYVVKGDTDVVFCEVLDYIFVSPHWRVLDVLPMPTEAIEVAASKGAVAAAAAVADQRCAFPMNLEPSDHLMLAATLSL